MKPEELLYCPTHEWVHTETGDDGNQIATIGISAFAVEQLTDLVFMELPEVGSTVAAGDALGEVESVKAVSSIYSPLAGEVVEVNDKLPDNLEILGEDPYQQGWIAKLRVSDDSGLANLLDFAAYQKQCAEEG